MNSKMVNCDHPALFQNMCVSCGEKIDNSDVNNSEHKSKLSVAGHTLFLSKTEAKSIQNSKINGLRDMRKLALILDLDNTLLHATHIHPTILTNDTRHIQLFDDKGVGRSHWVKLRPHLETFLATMSMYFQMSIYTAGTRQYAENIAAILDLDGKYFGKRIVSRTDVPELSGKSLERLFLSDLSMAVILDDREDVWGGPQQKHLIRVAPYVYFGNEPLYPTMTPIISSGSTSSNLTEGIVKMERDSESNGETTQSVVSAPVIMETDCQLLRCSEILQQLHKEYYNQFDFIVQEKSKSEGRSETQQRSRLSQPTHQKVCVSKILQQLRQNILRHTSLTFSGVIPVGFASPETHPIWILAKSLGANVSLDLQQSTTHLITSTNCDSSRTKKVNEAMARGDVWIVHVDWLSRCLWNFDRASELLYLQAPAPPKSLPLGLSKKSSFAELSQITNTPALDTSTTARVSVEDLSVPLCPTSSPDLSNKASPIHTTSSNDLDNHNTRGQKRQRVEEEEDLPHSPASSSEGDSWLEELEEQLGQQ